MIADTKLNPNTHILEKVKPSLASRLATLSPEESRAVVASACKMAAESIQGLESEMTALLDCCIGKNQLSQVQVVAVQSFAKWADQRYFDLRDKNVDEAVWCNWFKKARLATAVGEAFGRDSWEGAANAIYELSAMTDDPSGLINRVESELGKGRREGERPTIV